MGPQKPVEILKKGLNVLEKHIKAKRDELTSKLASKTISEEEEEWLDVGGNMVDEVHVIDELEKASNYERGLGKLDEKYKVVVQKLRELAGDIVKVAGDKRKREFTDSIQHFPKWHPGPETYGPKDASEKKQTCKKPANPCFTRRERATLAQQIEILDWHHANGENQTKTASHFHREYPNLMIKQPLLSKWLKEEQKWREQWENLKGTNRNVKRVRQTQHPEITEMMDLWVAQAMEDGIDLTGEVLRQKWTKFADLAGIPEDDRLHLSDGWLARFKARHDLKNRKRHGEGASANRDAVEQDRQRIQRLITMLGYKPRDVFNMDETGLFYAYMPESSNDFSANISYSLPPDRGLSNKKQSGVKGHKVRLTYAFTTNADGSEKLCPFIIGKAKSPRAFNKKTGSQLGFYYRNNAKAWMTTDLYQEFLHQWDCDLEKSGRKVLLLQDNFSGHIVPDNLQNIHVENFTANLTAHVQPLDQGIIRCFKSHYRARYIQRAIDRYESDVTPLQIYDIDQLEAMRLADLAWHDVDTTTIRNCWHKAGILPPVENASPPKPSIPIASLIHDTTHLHASPSTPSSSPCLLRVSSHPSTDLDVTRQDPIAQAERELVAALDDLAATGVLQARNRMDIESLLNPVEESQMMLEASDEEIFEVVMACSKARENAPNTGGDDVDDNSPCKPQPSRCEVLHAVSIINQYVRDLDDPLARKVEAVLGSLGHHTRHESQNDMVDTKITDFFKHF